MIRWNLETKNIFDNDFQELKKIHFSLVGKLQILFFADSLTISKGSTFSTLMVKTFTILSALALILGNSHQLSVLKKTNRIWKLFYSSFFKTFFKMEDKSKTENPHLHIYLRLF